MYFICYDHRMQHQYYDVTSEFTWLVMHMICQLSRWQKIRFILFKRNYYSTQVSSCTHTYKICVVIRKIVISRTCVDTLSVVLNFHVLRRPSRYGTLAQSSRRSASRAEIAGFRLRSIRNNKILVALSEKPERYTLFN